jgi:hypothetical protein
MALDDVYRIVFNQTIENQPATNVLHFQEDSASTSTPDVIALSLAEDFLARWRLYLQSLCVDTLACVNVICNKIHPTFGATQVVYASDTDVGSSTADGPAELTTGILAIRTATASKSARGRVFFSGIAQTDIDAGTFLQSRLTAWQTGWRNMTDDFTDPGGGNHTFIVWSKKLSTGYVVNDRIVKPQTGTQRRRRPRLKGPQSAE